MFHLSLHGQLAEVKNKTLHLKAFQRAFQIYPDQTIDDELDI